MGSATASVGYRPRVAAGTLITIEGLDGAGKSTLARELARELGARGGEHVELLREPGGVEVSERIRALVKDPALTYSPRTEALLYAAARAQLVQERVRPLLRAGAVVLLDRFVDSSLAYQGAGRALGVERGARDQPVRHRRARRPTARCCCASHPPPGARASASARCEPDRLEREDEDFFAAIASAYDAARARRARADPRDRRRAAARATCCATRSRRSRTC